MKKAKRTCVVIAGIQDSGTSALARVLNILGCDLPKNSLEDHEQYENGRRGPEPIVQLNDELLKSAGSNWDDCSPCSEGWFRSPRAIEFHEKCSQVFRSEFGDFHLSVFNEPQVCRLLPFWLEIIEAQKIEPLVIVQIRNPLNVAGSLSKRNSSDYFYNQILWLRYVLDSEKGSRGRRRFFCDYDRLIESWSLVISRSEAILDFKWPRLSPATSEEIDGFINTISGRDPELNTASNEIATEDANLPFWLREVYAVMLNWTANGENSEDYSRLDQIRERFDEACACFARVLFRGLKAQYANRDLQSAVLGHEHKAAELQQALAYNQQKTEEMERQYNECLANNAALLARHEELNTEIASERSHKTEALQSNERITAELAVTNLSLSNANEQVILMADQLRVASLGFEEIKVKLNAETDYVQELSSKILSLEGELAQKKEELADEKQAICETNELCERLSALDQQQKSIIDQLESQVLKAKNEYYALEQECQKQISGYMGTNQEIQNRLDELTLSLNNRESELSDAFDKLEQYRKQSLVAFQNSTDSAAAIAKLTDQIRSLEQQLTSNSVDRASVIRAHTETEQELQRSTKRLVDKEIELSSSKSQLDEARAALEQCQKDLSQATTLVRDQMAKLREANTEVETLKQREDRSKSTIESLGAHVQLLLVDLDKQKGQLESEQSNQAALWRIIDQTQADLAASNEQVEFVKGNFAGQFEDLQQKLGEQTADLSKTQSALLQRQAELDDTYRELQRAKIASLSLENQVSSSIDRINQLENLINRVVVELSEEKHFYFQRKSASIRRKAELLVRAGVVNTETYKALNPDVANSDLDPAVHFLIAGAREKRKLQ